MVMAQDGFEMRERTLRFFQRGRNQDRRFNHSTARNSPAFACPRSLIDATPRSIA
jgi:hypothetical protein